MISRIDSASSFWTTPPISPWNAYTARMSASPIVTTVATITTIVPHIRPTSPFSW